LGPDLNDSTAGKFRLYLGSLRHAVTGHRRAGHYWGRNHSLQSGRSAAGVDFGLS
jgi:hypothetical protein